MRTAAALLAAAAALSSSAAAPARFYVSSSRGDDANAGTSPEAPWKSLAHAAAAAPPALAAAGGGELLLAAGDAWSLTGTWSLPGLRNVVVGAFGEGDRPAIRRAEAAPPGATVELLDPAGGVLVQGLEVVGGEHGVAFAFTQAPPGGGPVRGLAVDDCWVHGVAQTNGTTNSTHDSQASAVALGAAVGGVVTEDVRVSHCLLSDADKAYSNSLVTPGWTRTYVSGLAFDANLVTGVRFNSVLLDTTTRAVISRCVFLRDTPTYLFLYGTTDIILGTLNASDAILDTEIGWRGEYTPGGPDGCAVDFETQATGMTVARNYIHHAWGAGIMVLGHTTTSTQLNIADNLMLYNGCNQTRDDHGGMSFLHPNSTGTIARNVFATCPGTPMFYALDNTTLDGWAFVDNVIDGTAGAAVVPLPQPDVTAALAPGGQGMAVTAVAGPAPLPGLATELRYTLDGSRPTRESPAWPRDGALTLPLRAVGVLVKAFPAPGPVPPPGTVVVESPTGGGIVSPGGLDGGRTLAWRRPARHAALERAARSQREAAAAKTSPATSAASTPSPVLCALVEPPRAGANYTLAVLGDDGSLTTLFDTGIPSSGGAGRGLLSGVSAPSAATGTWWASPPLGSQAAEGMYLIDAAAGTVTVVPVSPPPGFGAPGDTGFAVGGMAVSDVPREAVAVLAPSSTRGWAAVVELAAGGSSPARLRYNLTAAAAGIEQLEPSYSAFDPATRTLWIAAAMDGALRVVAIPLAGGPAGGGGGPLANYTVPFDMLAMAWVPALGTVVGVGGLTQTAMGLAALDAATGNWSTLHQWGDNGLYLSGLGQVTVDPTGRYIYSVFSNATGFPTLPVVDATTGAEVKRITVQPPAGGSGQPDMVTGIGFLPVSAPALAKRSA